MLKIILTLCLFAVPVSALAAQEQNQNQNQEQVRVQVSPAAEASMVQNRNTEQERTRTQSPAASTSVQNKGQLTSTSNRSNVANAVQSLIDSSYQIQNQGLGDQIRFIAQEQNASHEKIESSLTKAEKRSSFAKFFVGPNYKEIKSINQQMEQNRLRIEQCQQLMLELQNESEYQNLQNQISILEQENTEFENQVAQLQKGFSLFGWLNRILNR